MDLEFCCKYLLNHLETLSYPIYRVHDCHTITFCSLYCTPCYDYGFNNKRCPLKNFAKIYGAPYWTLLKTFDICAKLKFDMFIVI